MVVTHTRRAEPHPSDGKCGFPALRSLKLGGCEVTDAVVKQLSTISTLTELDIHQCVPLVLGVGPMSMRSRALHWSILLSVSYTFWMRVPATGVTVHHGGGQEGSPAR